MGLIQSIFRHRSMLFNPKYGRIGMFIMPYYVFFEMLGPLIEGLGYIIVPLAYFLGLLNMEFMILFLIMAIFYGIFLSTSSVFLEEVTFRRYPKWSHLFRLLMYGVLENFFYRQINCFWRIHALFQYLLGKRQWEYVDKQMKGQSL